MNRWKNRSAWAIAASATALIVLLFMPVSYDLCIGSVVEASWSESVELVVDQREEGDLERERAAIEKERDALERGKAAFERGQDLLEQGKAALEQEQAAFERAGARLETERSRLEELGAKLEQARDRLEDVARTSIVIEDGVYQLNLVFPGKSAREAEEITARELALLPEELRAPAIASREIRERVGGNVLAWASGGRIVIHAEGASPEELEERIEEEFRKLGGCADARVTVDGERMQIDIDVDSTSSEMIDGDSVKIEITN